MAEQRLSFALMLSYLNRVLEGVEDPRQPSNAEGTLGQSLTVKRLKARDLAETQTSYAHHFQPGNVLIPQASYKRLGLEKGQRYEVLATDSHGNGLMLRGQSGVALQVDPAQIRRKSVYEVEEMEIAVGDRLKWTKNHRSPTGVGVGEAYPFAKRLPQQKDNRLRWTRNDYALGRRNGQEFEVVGLEDGQVLICWRRGELGCFESSELAHLDYALVSTTYAAQGKSAERVIGALDRYVGRESFYVAVSRVKQELQLYASEDLDRLIERVERSRAKENPGEVMGLGIEHPQSDDVGALVDVESPVGIADPQLKLNPTPAGHGSVFKQRKGGLER